MFGTHLQGRQRSSSNASHVWDTCKGDRGHPQTLAMFGTSARATEDYTTLTHHHKSRATDVHQRDGHCNEDEEQVLRRWRESVTWHDSLRHFPMLREKAALSALVTNVTAHQIDSHVRYYINIMVFTTSYLCLALQSSSHWPSVTSLGSYSHVTHHSHKAHPDPCVEASSSCPPNFPPPQRSLADTYHRVRFLSSKQLQIVWNGQNGGKPVSGDVHIHVEEPALGTDNSKRCGASRTTTVQTTHTACKSLQSMRMKTYEIVTLARHTRLFLWQ
ncbi:hypothetical protein EDD17DRAFT_1513591 [Pisolithus thermaeus]|nr:hypothetical protein EDD17DRAFT_1513591 [Pisolithus thermaeus]